MSLRQRTGKKENKENPKKRNGPIGCVNTTAALRNHKNQVSGGVEPSLPESKSGVITVRPRDPKFGEGRAS